MNSSVQPSKGELIQFTVALRSVLKRKKQRVHPTAAIASDRSCVSLVVPITQVRLLA